MRSEKRWEEKILPNILNKLTPRIQRDILNVPCPNDLPNGFDGAYLFGQVESGKTIRSAFIMIEEAKQIYMEGDIEEKKEVDFINMSELFRKLNTCYEKNIPVFEILDYYKNVYFLVIDDIGTKKITDWVLDVLYEIINYRYEYLKKTVFTSNYSLEELSERLNDNRIPSRIKRMCDLIEESK